jgi:hypothetical protein
MSSSSFLLGQAAPMNTLDVVGLERRQQADLGGDRGLDKVKNKIRYQGQSKAVYSFVASVYSGNERWSTVSMKPLIGDSGYKHPYRERDYKSTRE